MEPDRKLSTSAQQGSPVPTRASPPPLPPRDDPTKDRTVSRRASAAVINYSKSATESIRRHSAAIVQKLKPRKKSKDDNNAPTDTDPALAALQAQAEAQKNAHPRNSPLDSMASLPPPNPPPPTTTTSEDSLAHPGVVLPKAADFRRAGVFTPTARLPKIDTGAPMGSVGVGAGGNGLDAPSPSRVAPWLAAGTGRRYSGPMPTSTPSSSSATDASRRASHAMSPSDTGLSPETPQDLAAFPDAASVSPTTFKKESPFGVAVRHQGDTEDSIRRNQLKGNSTADTLAKYGSGTK